MKTKKHVKENVWMKKKSRDKKIIDKLSLTPNTWDIQPSVTWSTWNMDEIFGLKFHLEKL